MSLDLVVVSTNAWRENSLLGTDVNELGYMVIAHLEIFIAVDRYTI